MGENLKAPLVASRQEENDAGKINVVPFLKSYYLPKNTFRKNGYFYFLFCSLGPKQKDVRPNLRNLGERALKELSNAPFCGAVALLVPELCADF